MLHYIFFIKPKVCHHPLFTVKWTQRYTWYMLGHCNANIISTMYRDGSWNLCTSFRWLILNNIMASWHYYSDVIMGATTFQITSLTIQPFIRALIRENIKAPRHWPLCGEIPTQVASNAKNVSIWWRHHDGKYSSRFPSLKSIMRIYLMLAWTSYRTNNSVFSNLKWLNTNAK